MNEPAVNLLPVRRQAALRRARYRRETQALVLVLAILGFGWGLLAWGQVRSLDRMIQVEDLRLEPLRQRQITWQRLEQEQHRLMQWSTAQDRIRGQVPPAAVLAWLSAVVPADLGLSRLAFEHGAGGQLWQMPGASTPRRSVGSVSSADPERVRVELAGVTLREAAVEELIQRLAHSGLCQDLRLEATRRAVVRQQLVHELQVSWQIPSGAETPTPATLAGRLP